MIVKKLQRRAKEKKGYKDNIMAVVEEIEIEKTRFGVFLAEIFEVLRQKAKQKRQKSD